MKRQFFGDKGITSTSANHIANLAKEAYEKLEAKLNTTSFIKETIQIIGSTAETTVKLSQTELITLAPNVLKEICEYKSLIAWLREAIKEKENLFKANKLWVSDEYTEHMKNRPQCEDYLTEQDVIESWTVAEQEEYLSLETICAVVGKYIHPNGPLSKAKTELSNRINRPVSTECSGRDTIIRKYYPEATEEEVNALFFSLQRKHREAQARLNGIKHKIDMTIREDMQKKDEAFKLALEEYNKKTSELLVADKLTREEKHKEIEALKIVIPNDLKSIYGELTSMEVQLYPFGYNMSVLYSNYIRKGIIYLNTN